MGARLFHFAIDPRYGEGVRAFYDTSASFYWGAYVRSTKKFTSADTGGNGVIIGYNYLLSLTRLTELIGSTDALPDADVEKLVDRVLPVLQPGYIDGYSQIPYLWQYPQFAGLQWEYGMGKELSEAQLSYVCGLWWLRTHMQRYRDCQVSAIQLPMSLALRLRGKTQSASRSCFCHFLLFDIRKPEPGQLLARRCLEQFAHALVAGKTISVCR